MNWKAVFALLGILWMLLAAAMGVPMVVGLVMGGGLQEALSFLTAMAVSASLGFVLRRRFKSDQEAVGRREGFAAVTFGWISVTFLGTIPFLLTHSFGLTDAFFEVMSGFTTTGATVLGDPGREIERLGPGLQFWRCMTQWLGGMGIVVLSVAFLSFLGSGGYRLLKAESPGGIAFEKDVPKISETAKALWIAYMAISGLEVAALLATGTGLYDAFLHTFTTMSTGGFSPHGASIAYFGRATQWVIVLFMFLAGINFTLFLHVARGRSGRLLTDPELRGYAAILVGAGLLAAFLLPHSMSLEHRLRASLFQVVSVGTTTGYATEDFDRWPQILRFSLFALMFVGGCMGSTGGGMKVARVLVYAKVVVREIHRLVYPRAVRPVRLGGRPVDETLVRNFGAFALLYMGAFVVGAFATAAAGYDLTTSLSASAAALGNIGPGLAKVGPMANWGHMPGLLKWLMAGLMLLGRLELFSVVVLLTPWAWKK